jgi:hypothetical protein
VVAIIVFVAFFRERSIYFEPNAFYTPVEKLAESEKGEETTSFLKQTFTYLCS